MGNHSKAAIGSARRRGVALVAAVLVLLALTVFVLLRFPVPPTPAARLALSKIAYTDLEGWGAGDPRPALAAFRRSCDSLLLLPPSRSLSGGGYGGTAGDWTEVCHAAPAKADAPAARRWFEANFIPFAVGTNSGTFTGYYEPQLSGSHKPRGNFRWPVYGVPSDLIDANLGDFRISLMGETISGRVLGHMLVPYATRAEIDRDGLPTAPILFYGNDPADIFFLQIQGSGRVRLENGTMERVAYADQNGWPYTPIGRVLAEEGKIPRDQLSMQSIKAWMRAHPKDARAVMETDQSYVFFKELPLGDPSLGSPGAEGVSLTPGASLAVDSRFHPLGAPFYVVAEKPDAERPRAQTPMRQLFVAQDIGGAIRGPVRGDVFFGYGAKAEAQAGAMKSEGRLFVLLPGKLAERVAQSHD